MKVNHHALVDACPDLLDLVTRRHRNDDPSPLDFCGFRQAATKPGSLLAGMTTRLRRRRSQLLVTAEWAMICAACNR